MTQARARLVSIADAPYYHCIFRCERRAFLCGEDTYTGQSCEHRRGWFIERLALLSEVFDIEVCPYAAVRNHCHLVVNIVATPPKNLTTDAVIDRCCRLYRGPDIIQRYRQRETLTAGEREAAPLIVENWRARLTDLSSFMRCLDEDIARRANAEDRCTDHLWERRLKSQALLDETALITTMAYVDLNPIRAGSTTSLADRDKTSVKQRLEAVTHPSTDAPAIPLTPFSSTQRDASMGLPFNRRDYLDVVESTGRCIRGGKRRAIDAKTPRLLWELGIASDEGLPTVTAIQSRF